MNSQTIASGFFSCPFDAKGNPEGEGFWEYEKLSAHWMGIFEILIREHGAVFDVSLSDSLSDLRVKCTSASGGAIVTVFVSETIAISMLLLSGGDSAIDEQIAAMFVDSVNRVNSGSRINRNAFERVKMIKVRPVMAVIPWGCSTISDDEYELSTEAALHFAAAFFKIQSKQI
jgi:hypothetical protein